MGNTSRFHHAGLLAAYVLAALTLSGCDKPEIARAKDSVRKALKDGDSAKFDMVHIGPTGAVCGWVNAKNRFGGYVGNTAFVADGPVGYPSFPRGAGEISKGLAELNDLVGHDEFSNIWDCNCKTAAERAKDAASEGATPATCSSQATPQP